jgi:hypothetical protein
MLRATATVSSEGLFGQPDFPKGAIPLHLKNCSSPVSILRGKTMWLADASIRAFFVWRVTEKRDHLLGYSGQDNGRVHCDGGPARYPRLLLFSSVPSRHLPGQEAFQVHSERPPLVSVPFVSNWLARYTLGRADSMIAFFCLGSFFFFFFWVLPLFPFFLFLGFQRRLPVRMGCTL